MANTYTSLHYHFVFSTANRKSWITRDVEERIWKYLGGIARDNRMKAHKVGGIEDHVHLLVGCPPTLAVSNAVQLLKGASSKWIHDTFPALSRFSWQVGYGAFTVSKSQLGEVVRYIENQREHHAVQMFQKEYLETRDIILIIRGSEIDLCIRSRRWVECKTGVPCRGHRIGFTSSWHCIVKHGIRIRRTLLRA